MSNPETVPKGCTEGKWYAGKVQIDDFNNASITIGIFEADDHYEDAICTVWGVEHEVEANAALIVLAVNELRGDKP